jgi:uncharacterized protein YfiM (DUF2279 family)
MKIFYFILLCCGLTLKAQYRPAPNTALYQQITQDSVITHKIADPWLGKDKAKHLVACALITLSTQYILVNNLAISEQKAFPIALSHAAFWGFAKEVYDKKHSPARHFSKRDLVADAAGMLLASALILANNKE